jgi:hypothetical protein
MVIQTYNFYSHFAVPLKMGIVEFTSLPVIPIPTTPLRSINITVHIYIYPRRGPVCVVLFSFSKVFLICFGWQGLQYIRATEKFFNIEYWPGGGIYRRVKGKTLHAYVAAHFTYSMCML